MRPKPTISELQKIAWNNKGKCLSKKYINKKLKWECKEGHRWFAALHHIKEGHWCPICNGGVWKDCLKELKNIAKHNKGKCLSNKYINSNTELKWKCKEGHEWMAKPQCIKSGTWCPICGRKKLIMNRTGKTARRTIEEMIDIAKQNKGKCLSKKYINSQTKLKWKCKEGHEWMAMPNNIKQGQWCPYCKSYKSEQMSRKILEKITGYKFLKCNPSYLKGLELDGFCKELNLAFEYNGVQHKTFHPFFYKDKKEFIKQQKRDKLKIKLCRLNNVNLIIIPHKYNHHDSNNLNKYIEYQLNKLNIII
jgi:hypothetical protein